MAQQGKQIAKKNNERVFQSHISNLPGATQAVINTLNKQEKEQKLRDKRTFNAPSFVKA